jgi:peptide/nickel transport system substrate-binding protein
MTCALRLSALLFVVAVAASSAALAQPRGGALRVAVPTTPTGYVITQAAGLADVIAEKLIQNALIRYDEKTLQPVPALATDWRTEADAKVWIFKLRQGVRWHDGTPFTAEDVKFTFDTIMNKDVRARMRGNMGPLETIEVLDPATVKFTFKESFAPFPVMVGYNTGILPRHVMAGQDPNNPAEFLKRPIGTGPFRFKESVSGSHLLVEANPDYWEGRPQLDTVVLKVVPDVNAQIAQLKSGDLDLALIQPKNIAALEGDPNVAVTTARQVNYFYVSLNGRDPMFADVRIRQALNHAVDKQAIIRAVLRGRGEVATGPISPVLAWAYSREVRQYPYDVARAKTLLDEAGWRPGPDGVRQKDGQRLTITLTTSRGVLDGEQLATVVQQYLQAVGVESKINVVEFGQLWTGWFKGEFQADVEYLITPPDPDLYGALSCQAPLNRFFYCNPKVDQLLAQGRATADLKARAVVYHEAQKELAENPPGIYLYYPLEVRAMSRKLKGFPEMSFRDAFQHAVKFSLGR